MTAMLRSIRRVLRRQTAIPALRGQHRLSRRYPQLKRNIFIITYGRSGSTLLQSLLNTIPDCQIKGENHNAFESLWSSYLKIRKTNSGWGAKPRPHNHPWYGSEAVRPNRYAEAMVDAFIDHVLTPDPSARYFGFKEIRYNTVGERFPDLLNFMHAHFKDPLFVFNTRNVEDVIKSSWWKKWKEEDVRKLVGRMDDCFARYHEAHPERSFMTSYESFSTDPAALRPIFELLNEPFDPEALAAVLEQRLTH